MVAKPLYPLYKNIIKPLDRVRYPELRYYLYLFTSSDMPVKSEIATTDVLYLLILAIVAIIAAMLLMLLPILITSAVLILRFSLAGMTISLPGCTLAP